MVDKPVVARLEKEARGVDTQNEGAQTYRTSVVDANGILQGEVQLGDQRSCVKAKVKDIASVIKSEVHSITADTRW